MEIPTKAGALVRNDTVIDLQPAVRAPPVPALAQGHPPHKCGGRGRLRRQPYKFHFAALQNDTERYPKAERLQITGVTTWLRPCRQLHTNLTICHFFSSQLTGIIKTNDSIKCLFHFPLLFFVAEYPLPGSGYFVVFWAFEEGN